MIDKKEKNQLYKIHYVNFFTKRFLCFKPLYWIEKKIDPNCRIGKPKYKRFSQFVYRVCKWSM